MEIDATCRDPGGLVHFLLQMPCNVVSLRKRQVAINDFPKNTYGGSGQMARASNPSFQGEAQLP